MLFEKSIIRNNSCSKRFERIPEHIMLRLGCMSGVHTLTVHLPRLGAWRTRKVRTLPDLHFRKSKTERWVTYEGAVENDGSSISRCRTSRVSLEESLIKVYTCWWSSSSLGILNDKR